MRCFKTFNSGNPPSSFLSHTSCAGPFSTFSQTRNRPALSSAFKGRTVTAFNAGLGNVRRSSVDTHVARCNQRHLSQNSIVTAGAGRGVGGTKVEGSSREASFSAAGAGQAGAAEVMVVD